MEERADLTALIESVTELVNANLALRQQIENLTLEISSLRTLIDLDIIPKIEGK